MWEYQNRQLIAEILMEMMKKSKVMEQRIEKAIDEKTTLLRNIDRNDSLKIIPIESIKKS